MSEHSLPAGDAAAASETAGRWEEADQLYGTAFGEAARAGEVATMVGVLRRQTLLRCRLNRLDEAQEFAELAREIATRTPLPRELPAAESALAAVHYSAERFDEAERLWKDALQGARRVDDDQSVGLICQNLGVIRNIRGDLPGARTLYLECIAATVRSGDRWTAASAYNNLGMACADMRDWMEAEVYFDRGIEAAEALGNRPLLCRLYTNRAEPMIETGDLRGARASLRIGLSLAEEIEAKRSRIDGHRFMSRIAREEGDLVAAAESLERGLALAIRFELLLERAEVLEERARLRQAEGRVADARDDLEAAAEGYREVGARGDEERALRLLDSASEDPELSGPPREAIA